LFLTKCDKIGDFNASSRHFFLSWRRVVGDPCHALFDVNLIIELSRRPTFVGHPSSLISRDRNIAADFFATKTCWLQIPFFDDIWDQKTTFSLTKNQFCAIFVDFLWFWVNFHLRIFNNGNRRIQILHALLATTTQTIKVRSRNFLLHFLTTTTTTTTMMYLHRNHTHILSLSIFHVHTHSFSLNHTRTDTHSHILSQSHTPSPLSHTYTHILSLWCNSPYFLQLCCWDSMREGRGAKKLVILALEKQQLCDQSSLCCLPTSCFSHAIIITVFVCSSSSNATLVDSSENVRENGERERGVAWCGACGYLFLPCCI